MGMAASQARLLSITARIHDVEYQAQSIQNAKVQLATQSDAIYQDYLEALDATTLTVKDLEGNKITATFNNLWGRNAVDSGNSYALFDSRGRLIVTSDEKDAYDKFVSSGNRDPYAFAFYMMDKNSFDPEQISELEERIAGKHTDDSVLSGYQEQMEEARQEFCTLSGSQALDYSEMHNEYYTSYKDTSIGPKLKELIESYETAEKSYKNRLYSNYGEELYSYWGDSSDYDEETFNYYVDLFKKIDAAGGSCVSIDDYNGTTGDAANDSEWLKNMIECGKISIDIMTRDKKTGDYSYSATSPSSDTYLEYTTTTSIDKSALAKAEAEYENETKKIDQKDKKYDMDLSKLETERTALTTEYDSVKKVISDNIERTFGIFS